MSGSWSNLKIACYTICVTELKGGKMFDNLIFFEFGDFFAELYGALEVEAL